MKLCNFIASITSELRQSVLFSSTTVDAKLIRSKKVFDCAAG